jgi:hypothetical protein
MMVAAPEARTMAVAGWPMMMAMRAAVGVAIAGRAVPPVITVAIAIIVVTAVTIAVVVAVAVAILVVAPARRAAESGTELGRVRLVAASRLVGQKRSRQ